MKPDLPREIGTNLTLHEIIGPVNYADRTFYRGTFDKKLQIKVFVRRVNIGQSASTKQEPERDRVACLLTGAHENIIRYYFSDHVGDDFHYFVTEWCVLSVENLFGKDEEKEEIKDKIWNSLTSKDILLQATKGLVFLHSFDFVHRNIKPSNVLISEDKRNPMRYVVKLSDFRTAKNLQDPTEQEHSGAKGSEGWIAPYPNVDGIQTDPKEDVFILGCFYYYVLDVNHRHPFGNNATSRNMNIHNKESHVYHPKWKPALPQDRNKPESQAIALIKDMIKYDPEQRPALETILDRAYFLPDDYYKLYDVPNVKPGLCVIFNQEKFDNETLNRPGSGKDKEALTTLFTEFGFTMEYHDDLTADDLKNKVNQLATDDYTHYACLVVCILSHGDEGVICGSDNKTVSIEDLKNAFCGYVVPSLLGKPKIWIIQACQGNQLQENQENQQSRNDNTFGSILWNWIGNKMGYGQRLPLESEIILPTQQTIPAPYRADIPRPPISDFLDIRATIPGFLSFRNKTTGSLMIQNLCKQLRKAFLDDEKSNRHLEDLLKTVQKEISCLPTWVLVNNDDKKDLEDLEKRTEIKWEKAASEDIKENPEIKLTFGKTYDDKSKKWIFKQRCQQTIEWRSTLINFIRFEKDERDFNIPKMLKKESS